MYHHLNLTYYFYTPFQREIIQKYRNDPKFSDRYAWANSADPDQTAPRIYTVCNSSCIFWMHYSTVKPSCLNFRVITANFSGVRIFRKFMVLFSPCVPEFSDRQFWANSANPESALLFYQHLFMHFTAVKTPLLKF